VAEVKVEDIKVGDFVEWKSAYIGGQEVKGKGTVKNVWSHFATLHPPVPPRWNDYLEDYVVDLYTVTKHTPRAERGEP
jgi:hypothetical protein